MYKKNNFSKSLLSLIIFLIITLTGFSQNVGISPTGALPPDPAAGLDINFTTKGLLIPRVALVSTTSFAPLSAHVAGMILYNTATIADVKPGVYFNDGTKWVTFLPKDGTTVGMYYWDGTNWIVIPVGTTGQKLQINPSGLPVWAP